MLRNADAPTLALAVVKSSHVAHRSSTAAAALLALCCWVLMTRLNAQNAASRHSAAMSAPV